MTLRNYSKGYICSLSPTAIIWSSGSNRTAFAVPKLYSDGVVNAREQNYCNLVKMDLLTWTVTKKIHQI